MGRSGREGRKGGGRGNNRGVEEGGEPWGEGGLPWEEGVLGRGPETATSWTRRKNEKKVEWVSTGLMG